MLGENNIEFELKNSHFPMYILHDIYLEDGDLSAQIDYLVFTKKNCFVISFSLYRISRSIYYGTSYSLWLVELKIVYACLVQL